MNDLKPIKKTSEEKPGFFKRILTKMDASMKEKANKAAAENKCCGTDSKGNKCC